MTKKNRRLPKDARVRRNRHSDPPSDDQSRSSTSSQEARIKPLVVVADDISQADTEESQTNTKESSNESESPASMYVGRDGVESEKSDFSDSTPSPQHTVKQNRTASEVANNSQSTALGQNPQSTDKNRGSGGRRLSKAEVVLRIRIVESLMFRGFLGRDIERGLNKQFGGKIPWTTVQRYIRHVAAMWEEEDALARPYRRQRQLRQLHDVADQLLDLKSWKEWLETQRLIARIEGNEAPQQFELSVQSKFDGWTVEELETYATSAGKTVPVRFLSHEASSPCSRLPGDSES